MINPSGFDFGHWNSTINSFAFACECLWKPFNSMIHAPDNLVRIPRFKHWEITSWYMTKNKDCKGLPPREHLRGRPWAERMGIGLDALILHGVLKP